MSELHHISDADFTRRQLDSMTGLELFVVEEHLLWCDYCTERAGENLQDLREKGHAQMGHISTDELEVFLAGGLDDAVAAARIEEHLRACQHCAHRILAIGRFLNMVGAGRMTKGYGSTIR